jgi:hypothetical protein
MSQTQLKQLNLQLFIYILNYYNEAFFDKSE